MARDRPCVNHDIVTICSSIIEDVFLNLLIVKASRATHEGFGICLLLVVKIPQDLLWETKIVVLFLGTFF